jgi:hypothetical protein
MNNRMNPQDAAIEIWQERYKDAKAVFLAGSFSSQPGREPSDLDLLVVFENIDSYQESFFYKDWPVEVFVHSPDTLQFFYEKVEKINGNPVFARMVSGGIPIPDSCDYSLHLQNQAKEFLQRGPSPQSTKKLDLLRYRLTHYMRDMEVQRPREEKMAICLCFFEELADYYFRSRNLWITRGKLILRELKRVDKNFAERFISAFEEFFSSNETKLLNTIFREIVDPCGGPLFDGFIFHHSIDKSPPRLKGLT